MISNARFGGLRVVSTGTHGVPPRELVPIYPVVELTPADTDTPVTLRKS